MIPHLPQIIYGAVIGHFIMAIGRRIIHHANVIIEPSKPPHSPGISMFICPGYDGPRKVAPNTWVVPQALMEDMAANGYRLNPDTGGFE